MLGEVNLTHNDFSEIVFSRESLKPWFSVTLDILIVYNFLKMSFKFMKVSRRYEDFLIQFQLFLLICKILGKKLMA